MVEEVGALSVRLSASIADFQRGMKSAERSLAIAARKMEDRGSRLDERLQGVGKRFGVGLAARIVSITAVLALARKGFNDLVSASDRTKLLTGRFEALTGSAERAGQMMQAVFDISTRAIAPVDAVGQALAKFTAVNESIGATDEQLQQFTENLIKLGQIGGATTNEMSSGLLQIAQGFGAGRLAGDEFKAVNEAMPLVIRTIAKELKRLPGEMRQLAADGEITAEVMLRALLNATDEIRAAFDKLPLTFGRATQKMETAWERFLASIGNTDEIVKAVEAGSNALDFLTDRITFTDQVQLDGIVAEVARVEQQAMDLEAAIDAARLEAVELIEAEVKFGRSGLGFADRAIGQVEQLQTELQEVKERLDFLHGREVEVRIKLLQLPADFTDPTEGPAGFAQELARRVPKPRPRLGTAGNPINLQNNEPAFEDGSAARRGAARTQERDEAARFIDDLRERIELVREDQQLAGLSRTKQAQLTAEFERQRIVKQFLGEIQAKGIAATPEEIAQVEALAQKYRDEAVALAVLNDVLETEAERQQEAERAAEAHRQAIERIGDAISGAIQQADSFTDALRNVAVALANILGQDLATRGKGSLLGQLFGAAASLGGSALVPGGGLPPAIVPGSPSAKGNVFERGNLVPFARGGVVSRPTVFPMARGAGLMGEAGPEAILPLSRGRDGRLGVAGGGVTVQIINNTSAQVREERARGPSGEDVRRFIVEEMQKATASGQIDRQMGSRFGLAPQRLVR